MRIQVASIANLIRMKTQSGRPQDIEDIQALEKPQESEAVQYFTDDYLKQCKAATPKQILIFLENYRLMQGVEKTERN